MLVVDIDALQTVDFLDFVHQVLLQFLLAEHAQNVVRIARTVHQRIARTHALAFLHVDVHAARHASIRSARRRRRRCRSCAYPCDFAVLHDAVDLGDDGRFARLARFEQLDDARQTAGDVLGLGGRTRDLGEHVAGVDLFAVRTIK